MKNGLDNMGVSLSWIFLTERLLVYYYTAMFFGCIAAALGRKVLCMREE